MKIKTNQWQVSIAAQSYGHVACQYSLPSDYITGHSGIRSSDFFSFSDDHALHQMTNNQSLHHWLALQQIKTSLLGWFTILTNCLQHLQELWSLWFHAAIQWYLKEQMLKSNFILHWCKCCAIIVAHTRPPWMPLMVKMSAFHALENTTLKPCSQRWSV